MDAVSLTFIPHSGPVDGLYCDDNHMVFKWVRGEVYASLCRRGDAVSAHLACGASSLRVLKEAINEFCEYAFWLFDWCKMILAQVTRPSVGRVVLKCGFYPVGVADNVTIYARPK